MVEAVVQGMEKEVPCLTVYRRSEARAIAPAWQSDRNGIIREAP